MTLNDMMTTGVVTVGPDATARVARAEMRRHRTDHLVVIDGGHSVGHVLVMDGRRPVALVTTTDLLAGT